MYRPTGGGTELWRAFARSLASEGVPSDPVHAVEEVLAYALTMRYRAETGDEEAPVPSVHEMAVAVVRVLGIGEQRDGMVAFTAENRMAQVWAACHEREAILRELTGFYPGANRRIEQALIGAFDKLVELRRAVGLALDQTIH